MPNNAPERPRGESPGDSRLRYSRRAVLFGLLGAGTLVGFRNPLDLLRQTSEAGGGPGSTATERGGTSAAEDDKSNGDGESPGDQGAPEQDEAGEDPPDDPTLYLYVPRLGIRGHTVREGISERLLALGAMKLPSTGMRPTRT